VARLLFTLLAVCPVFALSVRGRVRDAVTGEALSQVKIAVAGSDTSAISSKEGAFSLEAPTGATLVISTIGYRTERAAAVESMDVALVPDLLQRNERVDVSARAGVPEAVSMHTMTSLEFQNTASVLVNDPLRSVQTMPGVVSNDDFQAQFALRGAEFRRIGIVMDGVLLHSPFHTLQGDTTSASVTLFGGDILESVNLHSGPLPAQFGDRTAGIVEMETRPGARDRVRGRAAVSLSNVSGAVEGPIGKRASWLVAARKSYLQYLINRVSDDDMIAFGFSDVEGRFDFDIAPVSRLRLTAMHGESGLDRTPAIPRLGMNAVVTSDYQFTVSTLTHTWTPTANWFGEQRAAWMRERWRNFNRDVSLLGSGDYGEWIGSADQKYRAKHAGVDFGYMARRIREAAYGQRQRSPLPPLLVDAARGTALRQGAYLHPSLQAFDGKLRLSGGARWDHRDLGGGHYASPQASILVVPHERVRLAAAWGRAVQYAEIAPVNSAISPAETNGLLLVERSQHAQFEATLFFDRQTSLRGEFWRRWDRGLITRPLSEPFLLNGAVYSPPVWLPWQNTSRMNARGYSITLQRRSANRLSGWISYARTDAPVQDDFFRLTYPADYEQRHSVNGFANYRLRPSVNLSAKYVYGSGTPLRGFFQGADPDYFLASQRNQLRLPEYQRMDVRANKTFQRDRYRWTLFVEVVNAMNRDNYRFDDLDGFDPRTGRARITLEKTFPILPSVGLSFEF